MNDMRAAMRRKKLFLLDMDGTLYLGDRVFDHCLDFLRAIRRQGGRYLYLTNNSSKSVDKYVEKMERLHIPAAAEDFFTSTDAACAYLREHYHGRKIYALGTASFRQQLQGAGFPVTDRLEDDVDCLLMGFDTELTFQKLEDACILLGRGVEYLATNPDWVCPTEYGYVPDCGSISQILCNATGRKPFFIGKPEPAIARLAMEKLGCPPADTVLIGDRIYTDIACGVNAGIDTVLVFSGETTRQDWAKSEIKPTYTCQDIGEIYQMLQ
ncbi:MAG: HAD-IIA family hydrolase [Candidatus Limiplasma sp.]|nr:HAD-IIA family hydrolase [Clostridiales bacterium]MDY3816257.1 HAD-IIA family hydrolase [Candidatus Limiplasma sp.]